MNFCAADANSPAHAPVFCISITKKRMKQDIGPSIVHIAHHPVVSQSSHPGGLQIPHKNQSLTAQLARSG
jgi:hypothetical protein